jgi:hypothetical protein
MAEHDGDVELERADAVAGGETIAGVIAEEQFKGGAAGGVDFVGFTFDDHAGLGGQAAGGQEAGLARGGDFDEADEAGGLWAAALAEAEGGDIDAEFAGGVEDGLAVGDVDRASVDGEGDGGWGAHWISTARCGQTRRQESQRVQRASSMRWRA